MHAKTTLLYLLLCPVVFATSTPIWVVGVDNLLTSEMEHEAGGDDLFYVDPGDYTGVNGYNVGSSNYDLAGAVVAAAEPLSNTNNATEGFERAVTITDPAINMYFQMNAAEAAPGTRYRFNTHILNGVNNDLEFSMNGQTVSSSSIGINNRSHRVEFSAADVNAVAGGNVFSVIKTGGSANFLTFDFLRLTVLDPNEVFTLGFEDFSQAEFEQEGSARQDPNFYYHAGDYTAVTGLDGTGIVATEDEPFESHTSATDGFARAYIPGRPTNNVFFQLSAAERARGHFRFRTRLQNMAAGSSHDMEFLFNGVSVLTLNGVNANTDVDVMFDADDVNAVAGENVFSIRQNSQTGGLFIQTDYLELLAVVPEPGSGVLFGIGLGLVVLLRRCR